MLEMFPSGRSSASRYSLYVEILHAGRVIRRKLSSFQIKYCEGTRTPLPEALRCDSQVVLSATFHPLVLLITE